MGGIPYWPASPRLVGCDKSAITTEHETRQTISTSQTVSNTLYADGVTVSNGATVEFDNCWMYSDGSIQFSTIRGNNASIVRLDRCTIGLDEASGFHTFTGSEATRGVFAFPDGGSLEVSRCYGRHLSDLFTWGSGVVTIEDSFVHDFVAVFAGVHLDAVQVAGGSAFIRRNLIDLTLSPLSRPLDPATEGVNAPIFVQADLADVGEVVVENNHLNGGIYSLWANVSNNFDIVGPVVFRRNFVGPGYLTHPMFVRAEVSSAVARYDNRLWSDFSFVTGPTAATNANQQEPHMGAYSSAYSSAFDIASGANLEASASLAGTGTLTANAVVTRFASAALAGTGALTADAQRTAITSASLSGTGTLTASAQRTTFASVALAGVGTLLANIDGGAVPYLRPEFSSKASARVEFGH